LLSGEAGGGGHHGVDVGAEIREIQASTPKAAFR